MSEAKYIVWKYRNDDHWSVVVNEQLIGRIYKEGDQVYRWECGDKTDYTYGEFGLNQAANSIYNTKFPKKPFWKFW